MVKFGGAVAKVEQLPFVVATPNHGLDLHNERLILTLRSRYATAGSLIVMWRSPCTRSLITEIAYSCDKPWVSVC